MPLRRTIIALAAAGLLLASACGDDEGTAEDATAEAEERSAEETGGSGGDEVTAFCEEYDAFRDVDTTDPNEIVDAMRAVEAPAVIEEDWATLVDSSGEFAAATEGLDPQDEQDAQEIEAANQEFFDAIQEADANVTTFYEEECGAP